ncbi:MAG TPA: hypothetical protein VLF39_02840 [Candidatus Saccharimonadales bacterium]|nr:hypothetical protein [Candidatus Saccharimonadales bacterium]
MSVSAEIDCYELTQGLDDNLRKRGIDDYYVVGGMALQPLTSGDFEMDHDNHTIVAHSGIELPIRRDNGTRRDIDILVLTNDQDRINEARQSVEEVVNGELKVSVFGVERHEKLASSAGRVKRLFTDFLSHRTVDENGVHRYVLGPIEQEVPAETYEPWHLVTPKGEQLQVMHPVGQIDCYDMRSISGSRHKDNDKMDHVRNNVFKDPKMVEDDENLFGSWKSFINNRNALLWFAADQAGPSFEASLQASKGRALRFLEHNKTLVKVAQNSVVEKILNFAVRSA